MLKHRFEAQVRRTMEQLVTVVTGGRRITPDLFTVASLVLTFAVVGLLTQNQLFWAGWLFLFASALDMVDGAIARSQNSARPFGAFLDSTIDRYSEIVLLGGLLLHHFSFGDQRNSAYPLLIYAASHGSILTSYVRARAESLGFDGRGGLIERPGRVLLLVFGMVTGWLHYTMIVLAILTHLSAGQRFFSVLQQSRRPALRSDEQPRPERSGKQHPLI
jgi:CDP-diacylglycerol---glycerol-3-phosphate 3-phosphatidyltransferase